VAINAINKVFIEDLKLQLLAFLLVVSDPTLLSQLTLIGPEAILLFFFLLALNAILRKKRYLKLIALSFLGIITLRGMMLCGGLFLLDFTLSYQEKGKHFTIKMIKPYIIASLPAISYLIWRLMYRGYISSHPLETYGNAWGYASVSDFMRNFLRNGIVAFQRISDFGRIVPLIFIAYALYTKKERLKSKPVKVLLLSSILPILIVLVTSLIIKNPMGHRYFIPSYISLILLSFILLQDFKLKKFLYLGLMISLLLGNFIVYPDRFAQGWDASLAHLPYWQLRTQAITYISEEGIALKDVGTFFPNYNSIDEIDLNGNKASFSTFSGENDYVLYSNVFNLTDAEFELLSEQYHIIQTFSKRQVRIELLKKISPTQEANTANVPLP